MADLYRSSFEGEGDFDPFTDLLFNALLGFVFMFVVAITLLMPESEAGKVDLNAEYIITVTWPDGHPDDIDTYVEDPAGNIAWYHATEAGFVNLDRDDRGLYRDTMVVDGQRIENPLNQETVTIRGIVAGEYVVNVYHYVANSTDPVPVTVKVERLNPTASVVYYGTVELDHKGQEETAVRFSVDRDGDVTDVNRRQKSLTRAVRKPSAGNALQRG